MSAFALESQPQLVDRPRRAPRPVADPVTSLEQTAGAPANLQSWELRSGLVFVCPELRKRSLELLPEPASDVLATRPRTPVFAAPAPSDEPTLRSAGLLRYAAQRAGEMTRMGLAIIGGIFAIAMIAEILPH
jgi:hypothetical protein